MNLILSLALFAGCCAASLALLPVAIRFAWRIDAVDRGGYRKMSKGAIPRLGGLAIGTPLVLLALAAGVGGHYVVRNWQWVWLNHREWFNFLFTAAGSRKDCLFFALGGALILALGAVDDSKGLPAKVKLLGQTVVAVVLCLAGFSVSIISLPFFGPVELGVGLGGVITALWVVGLINAFNLIDGIDGLAAGMGFIGAGTMVCLSFLQGNWTVAAAGIGLAASLVAFLPYNFPPAKVFLGDTGSMFIGYVLACLSLIGSQKSETVVIVLAPMLALSFPVFETMISIARRYMRGVPIFVGDNLHTHHRLLRKGYSEPEVVLTLYLVGLLLSIAAVLTAVVPEQSLWSVFPYILYVATLLYVVWLAEYFKPTTFKNIADRRYKNKRRQCLARYGKLCLKTGVQPPVMSVLLDMCRYELDLRRLSIAAQGSRWSSPSDADCQMSSLTEDLLVKSAEGQDVSIRYEYERTPTTEVRQDVISCLAGVFDGMAESLPTVPKPAVKAVPDQVLHADPGNT